MVSYRQPSRNLCLCFFLQLATLSLLSTHFYLPNELLLYLSCARQTPGPFQLDHKETYTIPTHPSQRSSASNSSRADHKQYLYQDLGSLVKTVSHSRRYLFCKSQAMDVILEPLSFLLPLGRAPR